MSESINLVKAIIRIVFISAMDDNLTCSAVLRRCMRTRSNINSNGIFWVRFTSLVKQPCNKRDYAESARRSF